MLLFVSVAVGGPLSAQTALALGIAGRENAAVRVAASGKFVVVVWGASSSGGTDVYSAVSRDAGRTFGSAVRVNDTPFNARVGGEQPPQVALVPRAGADPQVTVVWTAKRPDGGRLLTSRSIDGARLRGGRDPRLGVDHGRARWARVRDVARSPRPGDAGTPAWRAGHP
ncbi:MAG: hypothetical protein H7305_08525 [Gemmatimonadaceae bacterium]|nr:hypothetical protein [Gemmatimonadaceae bacterium]